MKYYIYTVFSILLSCAFSTPGTAQVAQANMAENQIGKKKPLLLDMNVQIEATQAVNDMYNFKFARAEQQFRWIKQKYNTHPLPYFLLGLSEWWKIVPNVDVTKYDKKFLAYMDTAIYYAEHMFEQDEDDPEAAFFLAAAYAFQGRLYSERKDWGKATVAGKNSLNFLEICKGKEDFSPELLFGDALYNYYAEWVPENYPILKPVLMFFPEGNKDLGIKQLKSVANNAFYTRTEAQFFLMRILTAEGSDPAEAHRISDYLHHTFPDNPYFHRYYARQLYSRGKQTEAEKESLEILARIDSSMTGYEATSGRYAGFFLGQIYEMRGQLDLAQHYYERTVEFATASEATDSGYFLYALLNLGEIAQAKEEEDLAKDYYKEVKKMAKRNTRVHEKARENLKSLRRSS
ncbi:tetratricopeptide (TPR) repeat protein [Catalinimonas alkaloidigena]|uniref:tetratricopeptide repeat protein n=1 Tax=Catalinimonas alkaloidigena TaxID=1075417 RepID=UPI002405ECCD|nr:tetratricopeptide repeat protein [Catalinimonas alkaloidigena]MDF9800314.1 tetratricopeptide (TPR) repeat protein [Catalinimonas alkaloidigena]